MSDEEQDLPALRTVDRDAETLRLLRKALRDVKDGKAVIVVGGRPVPPRKPTGFR